MLSSRKSFKCCLMIITVDADSVRTARSGLAARMKDNPATRLLLRQYASVCRHGVGVTL